MTFASERLGRRRFVCLGLLTVSLTLLASAATARKPLAAPATSQAVPAEPRPSADASRVFAWIVKSGDNLELPFVIVDKVGARVFAFDRHGVPKGSAPVLLGLGRGDTSPPGIGQRRLRDIAQAEQITPAGRFIAGLGNDLGEADILWVDYDSALSLHRVITGNPKDQRLQRLATASIADNRISYGCINAPVAFFEGVILPLFNKTNGVVYILPEVKPLTEVFGLLPDPQIARLGD